MLTFTLAKPQPEPRPIVFTLKKNDGKMQVICDNGLRKAEILTFYEGSGMMYRHKGIASFFGFVGNDRNQIELTEGG